MIDNLSIVTNSHSSAKDVWEMFWRQIRKHLPFLKHYFCSDTIQTLWTTDEQIHFLRYDQEDPFFKQYVDCLKQVQTKYVLTLFEDHIFYSNIDENKIKKLIDFLENSNYNFLRLIRSDIEDVIWVDKDILYINPNRRYFFSTQPTIWNRESLIKCIDESKIKSVFEEPYVSEILRRLDMQGACVYAGEPPAGRNHYWSTTYFPHIEGIAKGKWIGDYRNILEPLWKEYGIDPNIRGVK